MNFTKFLKKLIALCFIIPIAFADVVEIPVENFEAELNQALEEAVGPRTVLLPKGIHYLSNEVITDKPGITFKGQGKYETILSFKKQKTGAQGILATGDQITFEDLTVEDSWGNGIKVIGANHVTFRNIRVRWTRGPSKKNGAYGVYPVLTTNVLVEDCEVSDSSDAGVYVGQSKNIIVRRNKVYNNVAGIEIENSDDADVYDNEVFNNTAGVLIFTLPDLVKKDSNRARIFRNNIYSNNHRNFAVKGSIVKLVPKGVGILVLASSNTEIFDNDIIDYDLMGISIANYYVTQREVEDEGFDPMPRGVNIYNNRFERGPLNFFTGNQLDLITKILAGFKPHEIVYDGIDDGTYNGDKPKPEDKICIGDNQVKGKMRYVNLHLDNQRKLFPFPGGPINRDPSEDHSCELELLSEVKLQEPGEIPPAPVPPTEEEVLRFCKQPTAGVNWEAVDYDCPELSDFNLFVDPSDPTSGPVDGYKYSLNNQLFTDYAEKDRFFFVPPGTKINYKPRFAFDFPQGSIITKTFTVEEENGNIRMMETRLLVKRANGWVPINYTWDEDGVARLNKTGFVKVLRIKPEGHKKAKNINYHAPNNQQCLSCHKIGGRVTPIGLRAKFTNRPTTHDDSINQLAYWKDEEVMHNLPEAKQIPWVPSWDDENGDLSLRAKAYMEINCAHCHNPSGPARNTGLFLNTNLEDDAVELGYCKTPVAAGLGTGGRKFAINPGRPGKSILYYRMKNNHPAVKMPQLGRSIPHKEGNKVIKAWIKAMPKKKCTSL